MLTKQRKLNPPYLEQPRVLSMQGFIFIGYFNHVQVYNKGFPYFNIYKLYGVPIGSTLALLQILKSFDQIFQ